MMSSKIVNGNVNGQEFDKALEHFYEALCRTAGCEIFSHQRKFHEIEHSHAKTTIQLKSLEDPKDAMELTQRRECLQDQMKTEAAIIDELDSIKSFLNERLEAIRAAYYPEEEELSY